MLVHNGNVVTHDSKWIGSYKTNTPTVLWLSYLDSYTRDGDYDYFNNVVNRIDPNYKLLKNGGSQFTRIDVGTISSVDGTLPASYIGKKYLRSVPNYSQDHDGMCLSKIDFPDTYPVVTVGYWTKNMYTIPSATPSNERNAQNMPGGFVNGYSNDTRILFEPNGIGNGTPPFKIGNTTTSYGGLIDITYADDNEYIDSTHVFPRGNGNVWHYNAIVYNRNNNTVTWYVDGQFLALARVHSYRWYTPCIGTYQYYKLNREFLSFKGNYPDPSSVILELAVYEGEYLEIPNRPLTSYIGMV